MVCQAEMVSVLVSAICVSRAEVHPFHCTSSVSTDSLRCHFGKEGIHSCGFDEA